MGLFVKAALVAVVVVFGLYLINQWNYAQKRYPAERRAPYAQSSGWMF